jgi:hypothetical protein
MKVVLHFIKVVLQIVKVVIMEEAIGMLEIDSTIKMLVKCFFKAHTIILGFQLSKKLIQKIPKDLMLVVMVECLLVMQIVQNQRNQVVEQI